MQTSISTQRGLTLVELMVAVTLGVLILLGLSKIYASTVNIQTSIERNSRHLENGRYALQVLRDDLRLAGYLGEYVPSSAAALPANPCSTAVADLKNDFLLPVQGYNDSSGSLSCLSDYRGGDVIVVRRTATCSSANPLDADCDAPLDSLPYFQASGCQSDTDSFQLALGTSGLTLKKIGCASLAPIRRFRTHIYYLTNNNIAGDGMPTLKRWELGATSNPVPLAEGIESLQFSYGRDTDGNGSPDTYTDSPASLAEWNQVVSVKIDLVSRSDAASNALRHEYHATVLLENPAGRKQ